MTAVWTIEDNEGYRETLVRVINQSTTARCDRAFASCEEALEALPSIPPPHVLLLDIHLPGMSGVEGIEKIKQLAPNTEIVMLTMYTHHTTVFEALCAGATGYLLKSAEPETIIQSISEVVSGGAPMSPQIARCVLKVFDQRAPPVPDYGLSPREKMVLDLLVEGQTKKEIAAQLGISYHTVDKHVRSIYDRLHVRNLSGAVAKAMKGRFI